MVKILWFCQFLILIIGHVAVCKNEFLTLCDLTSFILDPSEATSQIGAIK